MGKTAQEKRNADGRKKSAILPAPGKILRTARLLFAEHGFEGTTVRMIAQKAGINAAAICYYFRSKEQLYDEVFKDAFSAVDLGLAGILESVKNAKTWRAAVDAWVGRILCLILSDEDSEIVTLRKLVIHERNRPSSYCAAMLDALIMPVISILRQLVCMAMPDRREHEKQAAFISFLGQCTCLLDHAKPWDKVLIHPGLATSEWIAVLREQITGNIFARLEYAK